MAKVYFTKDLTSEGLLKIYHALGVELPGKVGVKVSTGEKGSKGYLKKELIGPLLKEIKGTIVECNTAYDGARYKMDEHLQTAKEHGFLDIADVDILDGKEEMKIPVHNGKHLKYDIVGKNIENYDSFINLAHGKGHAMGGFGANIKNQSIGFASRNGKAYIHSVGQTEDPALCWHAEYVQKDFIESMAEAAKAVSDYLEENHKPIIYITVINYLSVDCDCDGNQTPPVMKDIGIIGSTDILANDQAFIDLIENSNDIGKIKFMQRVNRQEGKHILPYSEKIGLGSRTYELIEI